MSKASRIINSSASFFKRYQSQIPNCPKDWRFKMKELVFGWTGFNKYGLYTDDMRDEDDAIIREALRRLPKNVLDARNFRLIRAMQLYLLRTHLPVEKWITYEQDLEYQYLYPYMAEIVAERQEIHNFGCSNYTEADWPADEVK